MKSVVLLTIALFLISAPAPDSRDVAEMTANFIVPTQEPGLQASQQRADSPISDSQMTALHTPEKSLSENHSASLDREAEKLDKNSESQPPFET